MSGVRATAESLLRRIHPAGTDERILLAVRGSRLHVGGPPHLVVTDRRVLGLTRLRGVEFVARPTDVTVVAYSDAEKAKAWLTVSGPTGRPWTIGAITSADLARLRGSIAPWLEDRDPAAIAEGASAGRTAQVFCGDQDAVRSRPPFVLPFNEFTVAQDTTKLLDVAGRIPAEERILAAYPLKGTTSPYVVVTDRSIWRSLADVRRWGIESFDEVHVRQSDEKRSSAKVVATMRDDLIDWDDEEHFGPFEVEHARQIATLLRAPVPGPGASGRRSGVPVVLDLVDEETGDHPSLMLRRYGLDGGGTRRAGGEPTLLEVLEDLLEWHVEEGAEVVVGDVIATFASAIDVVAEATGILDIHGRSDDDPAQDWWNDRYRNGLDRLLGDTLELEIGRIHSDPTVGRRRGATSRPPIPRPAVPRPGAIAIRAPEDAERAAAVWMRHWGWPDAEVTPPGADAGKDVDSGTAVAQVKAHMVPIGRPEIQNLFGVAAAEQKSALFFSLTGYTAQAIEWAEMAGVALFAFDLQGTPDPVNDRAARIAHRRLGSGSWSAD